MSRIASNNIFGRPAGKTQGIIFGSARSRTGKIVTTRGLVIPSNPNTALQQAQRGKFSSCQDIVRRLSPSIYQSDFNRSIGQLPGFQSMTSIFLNQMDSDLLLTLVTPINLGTLHFPASFEVQNHSSTILNVTWSSEVGDNGTANDLVVVLAIAKVGDGRERSDGVVVLASAVRSTGSYSFSPISVDHDYAVYAYIRGSGSALGLLSVANIFESLVV